MMIMIMIIMIMHAPAQALSYQDRVAQREAEI